MIAPLFAPLLLAALAAPPAPGSPNGPAIVVQTQPVAKLLGDFRQALTTVLGPKAGGELKDFEKFLKETFGEKGLEGLDLNRPLAAYGTVAEKPEDSTAVIVLPITTEKEFLDLIGRLPLSPKVIPVDGKKGLYRITDRLPAFFRFVDSTVYISVNDPDGSLLDPAKLLAPEVLIQPGDPALVTFRAFPDRLPAKLIKAPFDALDGFRQRIKEGHVFRGILGLGAQEMLIVMPFGLIAKQHIDALLTDTQEVTLRMALSPDAEFAYEIGVIPKPGTKLAASIAGLQPHVNRFAGMLPPSAAVALPITLPFSVPEAQGWALDLLKLAEKAKGDAPPPAQPVVDELLKGVTRTVKAGDLDIGAGVLAPNEKNQIHGVLALAYDDPLALEKALREMVKNLPEATRKSISFDAAKAGDVSLHTVKLSVLDRDRDGGLIKLFGEDAPVCVAFTPKAIYAVVGADPVPVMKAALAAKPRPARWLDVTVNPKNLQKMIEAMNAPDTASRVKRVLGDADIAVSLSSYSAEGGTSFKFRVTTRLAMFAQ